MSERRPILGQEDDSNATPAKRSDAHSDSDLARRAEAQARRTNPPARGEVDALTPEEVRTLVHNLRVHQFELEIQNEELRRTQEELDRSQARYFDLYDLAPIGYLTLDAQGAIVEANLKAADLLGSTRAALARQKLSTFVTAPDQDHFYLWRKELLATGVPQETELRLQRTEETTFWARIESSVARSDAPADLLQRVAISDISAAKRTEDELQASFDHLEATLADLRAAQAQLVHQERLAAIGHLAAGVAHDFNNILTIITLHAQLALQSPELSPKIHKRIETVLQQAEMAANLIQQLLDFGRRAQLQLMPVDLAQLFVSQVKLLRRTIPENIVIVLDCQIDPCMVSADATRMQQMLTNLALNARDAMPAGGTLTIALRPCQVDAGALPLPGMQAGSWIEIVVEDTGTGIPRDVMPYLFEPFFSTKVSGAGSGLGLPQVFGIVRQHDGFIGVKTEAEKGSIFTIYLPAIEIESVPDSSSDSPRVNAGRDQLILVVEDNETLREVLADMMEQLNYRTLSASNGREALAMMRQHGDDIALILSDLVMPEMGGDVLFHALKARGLTQPMIVLSGHPLEAKLQTLKAEGLAGWLMKPPAMHELATMLGELLAGPTEDPSTDEYVD